MSNFEYKIPYFLYNTFPKAAKYLNKLSPLFKFSFPKFPIVYCPNCYKELKMSRVSDKLIIAYCSDNSLYLEPPYYSCYHYEFGFNNKLQLIYVTYIYKNLLLHYATDNFFIGRTYKKNNIELYKTNIFIITTAQTLNHVSLKEYHTLPYLFAINDDLKDYLDKISIFI